MKKIAIVSDVHLKLRRHIEFERNRFRLLIDHLANSDADIIVFNGDLLDYAIPTLQEIEELNIAFTKLTDKEVYLLDGNHEAVTKDTSTYDYLSFTGTEKQRDRVHCKDIEGVSFVLCSWQELDKLPDLHADILITHYRSAMEGLYSEEVNTTQFINNYKLILLGDIHFRYSPLPHVFYTGSPYSISNVRDIREKFGYVELVVDKSEYSWSYKDLKLPQKIRIDLPFEKAQDFKPTPEHMYTLYVSGTLQELSTLTNHDNITYRKLVELKKPIGIVPVVVDKPFIDVLTEKVSSQLSGTPAQLSSTKTIITRLQGDI